MCTMEWDIHGNLSCETSIKGTESFSFKNLTCTVKDPTEWTIINLKTLLDNYEKIMLISFLVCKNYFYRKTNKNNTDRKFEVDL